MPCHGVFGWWARSGGSCCRSAQRQLRLPLQLPLPLFLNWLLTWTPSMATRRWCRNRIKKRRLSAQRVSDASRFRCQRRVQSVRSADRHHRGRLLLVTSLGGAREVTRLPVRLPAWSSGRRRVLLHPPAGFRREAAVAVAVRPQSAKRRCSASLADEALQRS